MKIIFIIFILFSYSHSIEARLRNTSLRSDVKTTPRYVPNEIIVKFKNNTLRSSALQKFNRNGAFASKNINTSDSKFQHIRLNTTKKMEDLLIEYSNDPEIEYVQPNYIYEIEQIPNDPYYSQQWGLKNQGQAITSTAQTNSGEFINSSHNPGTLNSDINVEKAWDYITDCSSILVAIIDTGVNYTHDDLKNNMWKETSTKYGPNFVDPQNNPNDPKDNNGHGSHLAGIIAAEGNNGIGITGICHKAKIMAIKSFDAIGLSSTSDIVSGINYAITNHAKIINMSFGGPSQGFDTTFTNAITNAKNAGILIVAAAGNATNDNDSNPYWPCANDSSNILCVAALDQSLEIADFSNFGKTTVDIGAPGTNIFSTWAGSVKRQKAKNITDWSFSPNPQNYWGYKELTYQGDTYHNVITNPQTFNFNSGNYVNSQESNVYRTFTDYISGGIVTFDSFVYYDTYNSSDYLQPYYSNGTTTTNIGPHLYGKSSDFKYISSELSNCSNTSTCTIGFYFHSDNDGNTSKGIAIANYMAFDVLTSANNQYFIADGTSMATPMVTGIAALIWAYNPNYTYEDVINVIKISGRTIPSLESKTVTGKVPDVFAALRYINKPTGFSVTSSE